MTTGGVAAFSAEASHLLIHLLQIVVVLAGDCGGRRGRQVGLDTLVCPTPTHHLNALLLLVGACHAGVGLRLGGHLFNYQVVLLKATLESGGGVIWLGMAVMLGVPTDGTTSSCAYGRVGRCARFETDVLHLRTHTTTSANSTCAAHSTAVYAENGAVSDVHDSRVDEPLTFTVAMVTGV